MFQFPPFAPASLVTCLQHAGLPHSDISGSKPVCSSPELNAAYHVLHRLQKPRHPPSALVTFSLLYTSIEWITRTSWSIKTLLFLHLFSFTRCLEIAVHNSTIDSLSFVTRYRLNLISSSNFTSLSFLKLVNELAVISQTGCKDTHFFLSCKFFCNIFSKILMIIRKRCSPIWVCPHTQVECK